jgi:hypothetical protein
MRRVREAPEMSAIRPLVLEWLIFYHRWALNEIHPTHPDVPHIVMRLRSLLDEQARGPDSIIRRVYRWL